MSEPTPADKWLEFVQRKSRELSQPSATNTPSKNRTKTTLHWPSRPGTSYQAARNIAGMVYAPETGTLTAEQYYNSRRLPRR